MMFRLLAIILYILYHIFLTNGQYVQRMPPISACASTNITFQCPNNYVPIVRSASYGIAQISGPCTYTVGDCLVDAMNIMTCRDDSAKCWIYVTARKLSQCNDQSADYLHAEYDCVPILMDDPSTKLYQVCQSSLDITTDHGIIESPGYPTQFQTTTTECFRAIHVPNDKAVRLWLTDLYIGSTSTDCADDHLFIVDNIQTYRHCGYQRRAYPDLCSITVLIQYLVTTDIKTYRGMRMYFEIVDRVPNDGCPNTNGTVTPVPPTTTTIVPGTTTPMPVYATLGIASPILSVQLCAGVPHTFNCPDNYVLTVITNIYGVTDSGQCDPHDADKHCVITTHPTFMCHQTCTYIYTGHQQILTCENRTAAYQYIEYQCIPTKTELISNISCPASGSITPIHIDQRGRFQSCNYPNLQTANYTYRLTVKPGHIMHFYSLDMSLSGFYPDCHSNKLTLIEHDTKESTEFCFEQFYSLIYTSCSETIDLLYTVTNSAQEFSRGAELYIESQVRPSDWSCGKPLSTTTSSPTHPTPPFITVTVTPLKNDTQSAALDEVEHDICFNGILNKPCPEGYTFMIVGAFYGIKQHASNQCGFVQGDCVQEALATITQCRTDLPTCYLPYSNRRRLAHCSNSYADYLHITSQCVPSEPVGPQSSVKKYDVCGSNPDITDIHGILTSPNFPTFTTTPNECQKKIVSIQDRVLKIWINELLLPSGGQRILNDDSDANEPDLVIYKNHATDNLNDIEQLFPSIRDTCVSDYLMINTPHLAYVYCGTRKLTVAPICSKNVVIHYKSTSPPNHSYKGFKLYFEWVEKPMGIICDDDPRPETTTPPEELLPTWAQNLELSPPIFEQICFGTSKTLQCPRGSDYVLSIIESTYAVTGSGLCDLPAFTHCHQEASLGLTCTHSCFIEYNIPKSLIQCGSQNADYINIQYECIPTRLPHGEVPIDICASTTTDTIAIDTGMMVSPHYPKLDVAHTCSKKIQTLNYKLWMIFIVDLFIEGGNTAGICDIASLTIYDGMDKFILCGLHQPELVLISCSDTIEFNFLSTHDGLGYRGFKVYFKTIDVPSGWACKPDGFSSTTTTSTARPPQTTTLVPPSTQISVYGGTTNGTRQYCKFPFTYQGHSQKACLSLDPPDWTPDQGVKQPWCSTTDNFDTDGQWGFCNLFATETTFYDICHTDYKLLECPIGYVIDILTANYAAKPDGNILPSGCVYEQNDCFESDASTIQIQCAGYPSCTVYHSGRHLPECQNRPSSYFHIAYTCIPDNIPSINTYDMCDSSAVIQSDTRQGFIISPNYPSTIRDINCIFHLEIQKPHQDIYLYIIAMDLNGPNGTGSSCMKDRLIVTADNVINEMCGISYTNLLAYTCHESVTLQLIRQSDAQGTGVKFYFEFRDKPPWQLCPSLPSTTTSGPTLSPTIPTTTTPSPIPGYFPSPGPRDVKTLCYPDLSGLMGVENFQCPTNYILVIHQAFYGVGAHCQYTSGDCTGNADIVYRTCAGKQSCAVSFINLYLLSECNYAQAKYLSVEYQCLPTPSIASHSADLCKGQIDTAGISGTLLSSSYPTYASTQCANVTLSSLATSDLVIHMYLLDLNIGEPAQPSGNCSDDYLLLSYQCKNSLSSRRLCGTHPTELLFSTCEPTDQIFASYNLLGKDPQAQRGFALLYHLVPKSGPVTSITTPPTTATTQKSTTPWTPSGPGPLSTPISLTSICAGQSATIQCDQPNYVLVIHAVALGVSARNVCEYSSNDCFEDRTNSYNHCGGKTTCHIFAPSILVFECNATSHYLYVEHQCIPVRPKHHVDMHSFDQTYERVTGGAIVSLLDYTPANKLYKIELRSNKLIGSTLHQSFKIFILSLNLPMRTSIRESGAQCSDQDPYIEIDDHEISPTRLCGNSHTRYLRETCSNTIDVRFNNTLISVGTTKYHGFEIYFESIQNDQCGSTQAPPVVTEPFIITNGVACAAAPGRERVDFTCTPDYGLVFLQSHKFVTAQPEKCDVTNYTCYYPSEQPQAQCSGQQGCSFTHINSDETEISLCDNQEADSVEFYYQCLPMRPLSVDHKYTFCTDQDISADFGFIDTPYFPNTYQHAPQNCSLTIRLPEEDNDKNYFIYFYIMELAIRDTSLINPSTEIKCFDSIEYTDGQRTRSLCGQINQPLFEYHTNTKELTLTLNIRQALPPTESDSTWRGARFFFLTGNQTIPSPPGFIATTPSAEETTPKPSEPTHDAVTIALITVGVLAFVTALIGAVYYRYRQRSQIHAPTVSYDINMGTVDGVVTAEENGKRSSIPVASLKGLSSATFVSPFFNQSKLNDEQITDDETNA